MLSYGKNIKDPLGCIHSIDNLVVEFIVKNFNAKSVIDGLAAEVFAPTIPGWEKGKFSKTDLPACSAYSWFKSSIWGGGFYIQYGQYKDFDKVTREWSEYPLIRIKFNPNKYWNSPVLARLNDWIERECDTGVIVKFDYAVDVPARLRDIEVHSRKEPGLYKGTRYYGQRNKHGRLKIYDKKAESDLPDDTARVEWTFCYGKPIVFDDVYWMTNGPAPLPDAKELGLQTYNTARLLLGIRSLGGDVSEYLAMYDRRTQKKLEPYTIGTGVQLLSSCFSQLSALLVFYCDALSVSFNSDGVNKISIGNTFTRVSMDDLEADELPF